MILKNFLIKKIKTLQKVKEFSIEDTRLDVLVYDLFSIKIYIIPNTTNKNIRVKAEISDQNSNISTLFQKKLIIGQNNFNQGQIIQEMDIKPMNFEFLMI